MTHIHPSTLGPVADDLAETIGEPLTDAALADLLARVDALADRMKSCTRCDVPKRRSEFHADRAKPDGLRAWCKPCARAYVNARRAKLAAREHIATPDTETCGTCARTLPADAFTPDRGRPRGLSTRCRACTADAARTSYARRIGA